MEETNSIIEILDIISNNYLHKKFRRDYRSVEINSQKNRTLLRMHPYGMQFLPSFFYRANRTKMDDKFIRYKLLSLTWLRIEEDNLKLLIKIIDINKGNK